MAQEVEKKEENVDIDMKNIQVYLTLDGKQIKPTTHILLKSWDASDLVMESANLFIECIFKLTQRRFHLVPASNWLRNEKMHSKKSNDGARCRIPIIFGNSKQMFDRLSFKYDDKQSIINKIKYESDVYIPGVDENAIKLVDYALIIVANDQNIKQFTTQITDKLFKQLELSKKSIDKNTKEITLSLEDCFNLSK